MMKASETLLQLCPLQLSIRLGTKGEIEVSAKGDLQNKVSQQYEYLRVDDVPAAIEYLCKALVSLNVEKADLSISRLRNREIGGGK